MTEHSDRGLQQDRLIDLVHDLGSADERAALERSIGSDPDLIDELRFLREARAALSVSRPVDVDRIVAALPAPSTRRVEAPRTRSWQWAAALATVALGGISLAIVERSYTGQSNGDLGRGVAETTLVAVADAPLPVSFGQGLTDFDDEELDVLFDQLKQFDGLPSLDPAPRSGLADAVGGGD